MVKAHGDHDDHAEHDDHAASAGGHGADPNAGVLVAEPPTSAWVLTAAGIAMLTVVICAVVAVLLNNADKADTGGTRAEPTAPAGAPAEPAAEAPAHGLAPFTLTIARG